MARKQDKPQMEMTASRIDAIIATAYNVHVGPKVRGEPLTPAKAATLDADKRRELCRMLAERGGSDLYTKEDAARALAALQA